MKKHQQKLTQILILITIALICSLILINYFRKTLGKELIICAEEEVKKIATIVTNNSIKKYTETINLNNLLEINKNTKEEITYIHYNTKKVNNITNKITEILETDLQNMTTGNFNNINIKLDTITKEYYDKINDGIILTIPLASATGNSLLANIGPKIPIKLKLASVVNTNIKSKITEYGLNNALIEIYVKATTDIIIQMPFLSKKIKITNKIPLTTELIQGNIPNYYINH